MMKYEIVVDDDDRESVPEAPWTANAYASRGDGRVSDTLAVGIGVTVADALADLARELRANGVDLDSPAVPSLLVDELAADGSGRRDVKYVGPLGLGIATAVRRGPGIAERRRNDGKYVVESGTGIGVGETLEEAWRYFLGVEFGPIDEDYDAAALWALLNREH